MIYQQMKKIKEFQIWKEEKEKDQNWKKGKKEKENQMKGKDD